MPPWSIDADVLRHALFGRSLGEVGESLLEAKITTPVTGQLAVHVLNRADMKDEDHVFGKDAHIAFDLQHAWVKYKLTVKGGRKLSAARAAFDADGELTFADYRMHQARDAAWTAVQSDLRQPRTLLRLEDVYALEPGEALAVESGGSLSLPLSFSWADALTAKLGDVLRGFPRVPLALKIDAGLDARASVRLRDQFSVVVSRTPAGKIRFTVTKARSRDHSYGIEVAVGAEASAVDAIEELFEPVIQAATSAAHGAAEEQAAADLEKRVRSEVHKRLLEVARWKASTGFAYEYARIDENTAIADFILSDDSLLAEDHALVMSGDLRRLPELLREDGGRRTLVRYLNETTLVRRSSSGFSLGIGKWIDVRARAESVLRESTRTSLDGFQLITFRGTRRYEEKAIPENDFQWTVDLKAQMDEFRERPVSTNFDCGLHYTVSLERARLGEHDLARMLDFAAMWDICAPSPADLAEAVGHHAIVRVHLIIDRDALAETLSVQPDLGAWADPLAAAMPYASNFAERRTFDARRDVYSELWRAWLDGRETDPVLALRSRVRSGLVLLEERRLPGSFAWCSSEGHPQLRRRLEAFVRGSTTLHEAMTRACEPGAIADAYRDLQQFWTQRLYVAASGRYLLDRARDAGAVVNATLEVEYGERNKVLSA
jgi:hypothetical protein